MGTYLSAWFYAAVFLSYCGLQSRPSRVDRSTWFGALNVVALGLIFNVKVALLVAAFVVVLWVSLFALTSLRQRQHRRALEITMYAGVTLAFGFHKLAAGWIVATPAASRGSVPTTTAENLLAIFETIAFSYIFLRTWDAVRAVSGGARLLNPIALAGYLVPFFMIPAGPVNVYADHLRMDIEEPPPPSWGGFLACADTVTSGLFLKFVIAEIWKLYFIGLQSSWPTQTFLDATIIFIYVYFDFFGYSLVALGVGRLLGIPVPVNFKAPFVSGSITEFWTRWHISLGDFVRRNLFIPTQVSMVRRFGRNWAYTTNMFALVACFVFVGLWHRFTLTFAAWGLFMGLVVALEKVARDRWNSFGFSKAPIVSILLRVLGPIYVFLVIVGTLRLAMPELMGQTR